MTKIDEIIERAAKREEGGMKSACGEYECPCHDDLDVVLLVYKELAKRHSALLKATEWQEKL